MAGKPVIYNFKHCLQTNFPPPLKGEGKHARLDISYKQDRSPVGLPGTLTAGNKLPSYGQQN